MGAPNNVKTKNLLLTKCANTAANTGVIVLIGLLFVFVCFRMDSHRAWMPPSLQQDGENMQDLDKAECDDFYPTTMICHKRLLKAE